MGTWVSMLAVLATLGGMMALLKGVERWLRPPAELTRKLLHVGMGCVVLSFPWVFESAWPVVPLAGVALVGMVLVRAMPVLRDGVGTVLNAVGRSSWGELCFVASVGLLFWLSGGDALLYCVPMLIMTLADATAALIGLAYGKVRYVTSEGLKSAEGSLAFFAIAFLSVHVPLLLFTEVGRAETLAIAVIIGVLSMLLEAIAWRGLDNLLIPLGAFGFLKLYLDEPVEALAVRLGVTVALLVFALSWRRRTSLDDSALMAAALFGYGAWMMGGVLWLAGPVLLFVIHVLVWPRVSERRQHSVFTVLVVVATAMLWLVLWVGAARAVYFVGYAVTFGVHLTLFGVHLSDRAVEERGLGRRFAAAVGAGWGLALAQWVMTPAAGWGLELLVVVAAMGAGVAVGGAGLLVARRWMLGRGASDAAQRMAGFVAGLVGTAVGAGIADLGLRIAD